VLKDFITVAGPLNVTHLVTFSKSEVSTYMRLIRLPRGPTMTFKVLSYSLSRDVVSMLKRNQATQSQLLYHPLLIMNHFSGDGMHLKLMATMFQNMFPSINVNKVLIDLQFACAQLLVQCTYIIVIQIYCDHKVLVEQYCFKGLNTKCTMHYVQYCV